MGRMTYEECGSKRALALAFVYKYPSSTSTDYRMHIGRDSSYPEPRRGYEWFYARDRFRQESGLPPMKEMETEPGAAYPANWMPEEEQDILEIREQVNKTCYEKKEEKKWNRKDLIEALLMGPDDVTLEKADGRVAVTWSFSTDSQ